MYSIWHEIFKKLRRFLGLRSRSRWGSSRRSPSPLVRRGFLPSAIAASRLRRLQFLELGGPIAGNQLDRGCTSDTLPPNLEVLATPLLASIHSYFVYNSYCICDSLKY